MRYSRLFLCLGLLLGLLVCLASPSLAQCPGGSCNLQAGPGFALPSAFYQVPTFRPAPVPLTVAQASSPAAVSYPVTAYATVSSPSTFMAPASCSTAPGNFIQGIGRVAVGVPVRCIGFAAHSTGFVVCTAGRVLTAPFRWLR